jgi:hypothetical protein
LFDEETPRYTPLDFRLTASAQFRLLATLCSILIKSVDTLQVNFLAGQLVSTQVMSQASFYSQANVLLEKFNVQFSFWLTSTHAAELLMLMIRVSVINSVVHTNAFQMSTPGSNQYQIVNNFYPLNDNASFSKVSDYDEYYIKDESI